MSNKTNKHWTTWFISDTHFWHKSVIGFCDRPFHDEFFMNETLIDNINKLVKPEDLLIWVGDIFLHCSKEEAKEIMDRIKCKRNILVRGNHDRNAREMMNIGFILCVESMEMMIANEKVLISHYPYRMDRKLMRWLKIKKKIHKALKLRPIYLEKHHDRRPENKGQFLIHGHTHDKEKVKNRMIHVGVDAWGFKPVNIQQISNIICDIKKSEKK